jgi:uncharacterized protein
MTIVDRRKNQSDKTLGSRQRFIRRAKAQVKKAISEDIANTNIKDFGKRGISIPVKGIDEATFNPDTNTGNRKRVMDRNDQYEEGQLIAKPRKGGGQGGGSEASDSGESEDEFSFSISQEEYLQEFFEDLELPNLVEKELKELVKMRRERAGFTSTGNPANLSIANTVKRSLGRRIALNRPKQETIDELKELLEDEESKTPKDIFLIEKYSHEIEALENRMKAIPYVDKTDLRYRNSVMKPAPNTKAIVVFLMDVSGSMTAREKDISKRFFILLYLLLMKKYKDIEIVFVRHHTRAEECSEEDFFYKQESGGTVVSSGLNLVNDILTRYSPNEYNLYVAQASDGDNWSSDNEDCLVAFEKMLPMLQYYFYIDVPNMYGMMDSIQNSDLWDLIAKVEREYTNVSMAKVKSMEDIWPVFLDLFSKEET